MDHHYFDGVVSKVLTQAVSLPVRKWCIRHFVPRTSIGSLEELVLFIESLGQELGGPLPLIFVLV